MPNGHKKFPKLLPNLAKYYINLQKITKDFKKLAKVAKFRQVWSHWQRTTKKT